MIIATYIKIGIVAYALSVLFLAIVDRQMFKAYYRDWRAITDGIQCVIMWPLIVKAAIVLVLDYIYNNKKSP